MRRPSSAVRLLVLLPILLILGGWTPYVPPQKPGEDPSNVLLTIRPVPGGAPVRLLLPLPLSACHLRLAPLAPPPPLPPPRMRVHPLLRAWLAGPPDTTRRQFVVTFADPVEMPRFPRASGPGHTRADSIAATSADSLVESIRGLRAPWFTSESLAVLQADTGAVVARKYWIVQALLVRMRVDAVPALLARAPDLYFIAPNASGEPPPDCAGASSLTCTGTATVPCLCKTLSSTSANSSEDARSRMGATSPAWSAAGAGPIALFDTGVRDSHIAFTSLSGSAPSHLRTLADLVDHAALSDGRTPSSADGEPDGHGTSSAAILTALGCPAARNRGVTDAPVDVFNVYEPSSSHAGLIRDAVLTGFEQAIYDPASGNLLDPVLVAEMQASGGDDCDISMAADNAFATGAVVVAAQGNANQIASVGAPARSHWSIAAGNYDVITPGTPPNVFDQAPGPADDGRVKPEVLAPTNTWVAANREIFTSCHADPNQGFHGYTGTSGATPYVGGAAALLSHLFASLPYALTDPGVTCAALVASGPDTWQGAKGSVSAFDGLRGTGPIKLPDLDQPLFTGNVVIPSVTTYWDVPIDLSKTGVSGSLEAAVWWADPRVRHWRNNFIQIAKQSTFGVSGPFHWQILNPPFGPQKRSFLLWAFSWISYEHSDVDIELIPPGATAGPESRDGPSVFERTSAPVSASDGTWTLRISACSLPAGPQKVYYVVTVR